MDPAIALPHLTLSRFRCSWMIFPVLNNHSQATSISRICPFWYATAAFRQKGRKFATKIALQQSTFTFSKSRSIDWVPRGRYVIVVLLTKRFCLTSSSHVRWRYVNWVLPFLTSLFPIRFNQSQGWAATADTNQAGHLTEKSTSNRQYQKILGDG